MLALTLITENIGFSSFGSALKHLSFPYFYIINSSTDHFILLLFPL